MKKDFYKKSLESNADFKSTCCENILSNLYSLMLNIKKSIIYHGFLNIFIFIIRKHFHP